MPKEIIITIPKKRRTAQAPRKGVIRPGRRSEYLARRRRKGSYINFYDLGQRRSGDNWVDVDFAVAPQVDVFNGGFTQNIGLVYQNQLKAKIFEVDVANWNTQYRKFGYEDAERYGVDLLGNNVPYSPARNGSRYSALTYELVVDTVWEEGGLNVPEDLHSFYIYSFGGFIPLMYDRDTPENGWIKVTAIDDFNAPEVPDFAIAKKADVFLVPAINYFLGQSFEEVGELFPNMEVFLGENKALQRSLWLNKSYPDNTPLMTFNPVHSAPDLTTLNQILDTYRPTARCFTWDQPYIPGTVNEVPPSGYPRYGYSATAMLSPQVVNNLQTAEAGTFAGLIKQNGNTYYLWFDQDSGVTADRIWVLYS